MARREAYSVIEITQYIKGLFNDDIFLRRVRVSGEVSNCKEDKKGHIYFTIKDDYAILNCAMWSSKRAAGLDFALEEGQHIEVSGQISVYEKFGEYRLYADTIQRTGLGRLFEEFEKLKKKLKLEGLFEERHKKEIPRFPDKVGIVTSRTGAVIEDIKRTAKEINPYVQLILYPAKVQGEGSAESLIAGIKRFEKEKVDTIIIGRGGGSTEDLWCFNDEKLARAVFSCSIPVISAVGHQTDRTLVDEVSDYSAATPTAAAAVALPNRNLLRDELAGYKDGFTRNVQMRIQHLRAGVEKRELIIKKHSPENRVKQMYLELNSHSDRFAASIQRKLTDCDYRLSEYKLRLNGMIREKFEAVNREFIALAGKIEGSSPMARLTGGYAYVENERKENINSVKLVKIDERLRLIFKDGSISARVEGIEEKDGREKKQDN